MVIEWKLTKRRGNWRPYLEIKMLKSKEEEDLSIVCKAVSTVLPEAASGDAQCLPGNGERQEGWAPIGTVKIGFPDAWDSQKSVGYYLPWRPGANPTYPEVEETVQMLQAAWDEAFQAAFDSGPIEVEGRSDHSATVKRAIAPMVAARKMLKK